MGCGAQGLSPSRLTSDLGGLLLALTCLLVLALPRPARADAVLSQQKNCHACHAVDGAITGPSLKAVAQKYASDRAAADKLTTRILKGGVGVWGPVPMPANPQLNDTEARRLAVWILGLK
jgi:cytochrome c